jgi:hypothetical protein
MAIGLLLPLGGCQWGASFLAGEPPAWDGTLQKMPGIDGRLEWSGQQSEIQGRLTMVARTQEEWDEMWRRAAQPPPAPLPEGWMAVAVFAGLQNSGGTAVRIEQAGGPWRANYSAVERMLVTYRISQPPSDAIVTQAQASPWAIRLVRATPLRVEFERLV